MSTVQEFAQAWNPEQITYVILQGQLQASITLAAATIDDDGSRANIEHALGYCKEMYDRIQRKVADLHDPERRNEITRQLRQLQRYTDRLSSAANSANAADKTSLHQEVVG